MEKDNVIPDVIKVAPPKSLEVFFGEQKVVMGIELKPKQAKEAPQVTWDPEEGALYTLCMTDPDAPSRKDPKYREWHHWLVVNIPGNEVEKGDVWTEYVGAAPPQDTGLHRYVILLYKQTEKLKPKEKPIPKTTGKGRGKFSISKFADSHKLGSPIAGNYFVAEYDDSVPNIQQGLKG